MSQFGFIQGEWPALHEAAAKAESLIYPDPRTSCFYARRALELLVAWLYKHDASLRLPYQDNLGMLDTGIDVPEVVNLVLFKLVRSKTKFWQMLGRGTRLCADLFGPGKPKEGFFVFDYCQNLEFFSQYLPATEGAANESLGKRLFNARLELIGDLDRRNPEVGAIHDRPVSTGDPKSEREVGLATADLLRREVAAMNVDNFVVRPHRRWVETYARSVPWETLTVEAMSVLAERVAGLGAVDREAAPQADLHRLRGPDGR